MDKEPPVPEAKNRAQNPSTGGSEDTGGFFHTEGGGGVLVSETQQRSFKCYHCADFQTNNEGYYENHTAANHPGKPCYPTIVDLERHRLQAQGKDWEI